MAGEHLLDTPSPSEQIISASKLILHQDYDPVSSKNDIGIIILSNSLVLNNSSVEKVKLPPPTFIPNSGDMMTVAGWGKTEVSRIRFSTGLYSKKTGSMTLHYLR